MLVGADVLIEGSFLVIGAAGSVPDGCFAHDSNRPSFCVYAAIDRLGVYRGPPSASPPAGPRPSTSLGITGALHAIGRPERADACRR